MHLHTVRGGVCALSHCFDLFGLLIVTLSLGLRKGVNVSPRVGFAVLRLTCILLFF